MKDPCESYPGVDILYEYHLIYFSPSPCFVDVDVYGVLRQESPDVHRFFLAITAKTPDRLSLVRLIDLLCRGEEGRKEDRVIS